MPVTLTGNGDGMGCITRGLSDAINADDSKMGLSPRILNSYVPLLKVTNTPFLLNHHTDVVQLKCPSKGYTSTCRTIFASSYFYHYSIVSYGNHYFNSFSNRYRSVHQVIHVSSVHIHFSHRFVSPRERPVVVETAE